MSLTFELLRPDDLLALRVNALNLKLDASDPQNPKLVIEQPARPSYLVIEFPPQSITEKAYFEVAANVPDSSPSPQSADDPLDPAGSVPSRMAGTSRLVFRLPATMKQVPFNMAALLDWSKFDLVLSPTALGQALPPPIVPPTDLQTALEIPYRVILSPSGTVGWNHAKLAITHEGRTELWHTRLAKLVNVTSGSGTQKRLVDASDTNTVPLRAIWSPDFVDHGPLPGLGDLVPFLSAMSPRDRAEMVILTSGASGYYVAGQNGVGPWVPQPIQASRLFLSSLGGWLSSRGDWPLQPSYTPTGGGETQSLDISEWVHLATQGRDHYVRIVYEGYLYPFGHRAALVKVTERKVVSANGAVVQYPTAYLKQHMYVVVREKEKTYASASYKYAGREMPLWRSVRIQTVVTPDIDKPYFIQEPASGGAGTQDSNSFWIDVGGTGFPFHLTGIDLSGQSIDFLASLIFMDEGEQNPTAIQGAYKGSGNQRQCLVRGQKVAYADPGAGDTFLKTNGLFFDSQILEPAPPYTAAPFVPSLDQAAVTVPALEQMLGTSSPVNIQLYNGYLLSLIHI